MLPAVASIILLAAWLGAAVLVAGVVAPAAFAVLPSRAMAGALVGRVLPVLFWSGMVVGIGVIVATWNVAPRGGRIGAVVVLIVSCAAAQLVVAPRIARLRERIGGSIDALDAADPMRLAFGRLHGVSVAALGVGAAAALVALVLVTRLVTSRSTS
ncbi:MAG TPA: DUF4149 domain-containing protein [Gemmatimonadaceae bacterium]|jgi:hypothetical protein